MLYIRISESCKEWSAIYIVALIAAVVTLVMVLVLCCLWLLGGATLQFFLSVLGQIKLITKRLCVFLNLGDPVTQYKRNGVYIYIRLDMS